MNLNKLLRMMPKSIRWKHSVTSSIWILLASTAWANVVITGTRIIYPESAREVTVKLDNRGDKPALVQTWIDNGDSKTQANKADVPFVLLPPVFRIEPGRGQTLRMTYTHDPLPQDRESMFWLNVLDIPPNPDSNESTNLLRLAFRSRLKIFFRPEGLSAEGAAAAANAVTWKLVRAPRGEGFAVEAGNASPYYVNISDVALKIGATEYRTEHSGVIEPGSTHTFTFNVPLSAAAPGTKLNYSIVNDLGGTTEASSVIGQP